ncbi:hypothetical protein Tco_0784964, partial [Tanacetum coccineum]
MIDEKWMKVPITFPPVSARDLSKEALVVEAEVEGYLVRRIHIDEGASIKIMYEHCFNMLHPSIRARLTEMQTTVSRFLREQVKPLGKIELDVCFGGSGLCRRAIMKFTNDKVPNPLGNCNFSVSDTYGVRMHKSRKKSKQWNHIKRQNLKRRFPFEMLPGCIQGYHQVKMAEEDEEKTAFNTDQ